MDIIDIKNNTEQKMQKSVKLLKSTLIKIRTGRANTSLIEHIQVSYYGCMVPISQVANLALIDVRTIGIQPWEKNMVRIIEKAIRDSGLGLNPLVYDSTQIRILIPTLTEERRRELVKIIKHETETMKITIRNFRREANEQIKTMLKNKLTSEDEEHHFIDVIQKITNSYIMEIDKIFHVKEDEIMKV